MKPTPLADGELNSDTSAFPPEAEAPKEVHKSPSEVKVTIFVQEMG